MSPLVVPFRNLHQMRDVYEVSPGGDAARLSVHIATRSDGLPGSGTILDPYNGTLDFDKAMRRLTGTEYLDGSGYPLPMDVYIHQGTYLSDGRFHSWLVTIPPWAGVPFYPDIETAKGFWHLPNMHVIGVGRVVVQQRAWPLLVSGLPWPYPHVLWATDDGYFSLGGDNATLEGIHLDCAADTLVDRPANAKILAVILAGDDCAILRCSYDKAAGWDLGTKPVESITLGTPGICTITAHGFKTGDNITFSDVKMAGGAAGTEDDPAHSQLNGLTFYAKFIDVDNFSLWDSLGDNPIPITIPVSVPGIVLYGNQECFAMGIHGVIPAALAYGGPSIAKDIHRARIVGNHALSFVGGYGVCFVIFAGSTGSSGVIRDNDAINHPYLTCFAQVIGKGHEVCWNRTDGVNRLIHLDTGVIEELLIGYNTVLNSPQTPISLYPTFAGSEQRGIRIVGNYLHSTFTSITEVASMIICTQGSVAAAEPADIIIEGNILRWTGTAPTQRGLIIAATHGLKITNNVIGSNMFNDVQDSCTGVNIAGNHDELGAEALGLTDTRLSAGMSLSVSHTTSSTPGVATKVPFDTVKYDYSRAPTVFNIALGRIIIPETGIYRVGVSAYSSPDSYTWVVRVNGDPHITLAFDLPMGGFTLGFGSMVSSDMEFLAGHYLEFWVSSLLASSIIYGDDQAAPGAFCFIDKV